MTKTLKEFYDDLGARESGGNYHSINKYGYVGKYQMGESAMIDAGYYKKSSGNYNNDWSGQFTGKDGIYSLKDFLQNKQAQENAQKAFKKAQWNQLKSVGADKYIGKEINGVKITQSGLLAAAHLKGPGAVSAYLRSNGQNNPKDRFGTSVENYMKKFGGYNISDITGLNSDSSQNNVNDTNSQPQNNYAPFQIGIEYNEYLPNYDSDNMINSPRGQQIMQDMLNPWDMIPVAVPDSLRNINFNSQPTSYATPVDFVSIAQNLGLNVPESFINQQNSFNTPQQPQSDLVGYTNPITGDNRIFTREDVGQMSQEEFDKNEKAIMAQVRDFKGTMPTNEDMRRKALNGGTIYVNPYMRSDGTEVKGYYRSRPKF